MGIFGSKNKEFPPLISAVETPVVNFNTVIEYLEGLSKLDYEKTLKVVNIYRNANKDVHNVLGIKEEPRFSIDKESKPDDDEISLLLHENEPKPKDKKKG